MGSAPSGTWWPEAKRRFFSVGITTNGTLPLDVGSDVLWVSLDGLRKTHDRLRGAPVFERIIESYEGVQSTRGCTRTSRSTPRITPRWCR